MKALSYTSKSITGFEGQGILYHHRILGHYFNEVDWLTNTDSNRLNALFTQATGVKGQSLNLYGKWYLENYKKFSSWENVYDAIDIEPLKDYDALFVIGGIEFPMSNLARFGKRRCIFPKDSGQISFQSHATHLYNILAMLKAHKIYGIPLHEIAFGPNEMSMDIFHDDYLPDENYFLYHGYDIPLYNIKRCDSLQMYMKSSMDFSIDSFLEQNAEKVIDFAFGYTVLSNSNRKHFIDSVDDAVSYFNVSKLFVRNDSTKNKHIGV